MSLKITLKPRERLVIGGAVVTNGDSKCDLIIENKVTLLREKDIMREEDATSPARRIYFTIQLMYIDSDNLTVHHKKYWELVQDVVTAAPSTIVLIDQISEHIVNNRYYQALKAAARLIDYEREVTKRV